MSTMGFLGPEGSHSAAAAKAFATSPYCDEVLTPVMCPTLLDVLTGLEQDQFTLGIIPVENALEGSVTEVLEGLHQTDLHALAEFTRPIVHGLLVKPGTSIHNISTLVSHTQALGQCRQTIRRVLPEGVTMLPVASTALAAEQVALGKACAALGSAQAADTLGLSILVEQMSDFTDNQTRFMVLSRSLHTLPTRASLPVKTSLRVDVGDYPGSLVDVLLVFKRANVNLTKIESRPSRLGLGRYQFYIDVMADLTTPPHQRLLPDLTQYFCTQVHSLGPYYQLGALI